LSALCLTVSASRDFGMGAGVWQKSVAHGEECCSCPVRHSDLGVDVLDVVADGLWCHDEAGCDLLVRQAAHGEAQDVDLSGGETGDVCRARDAMASSGKHRGCGIWIEAPGASVAAQFPGGLIG
jgi:hypothetical protein